MNSTRTNIILAIVATFFLSTCINAQSTIFNVPSTDVVGEKEVYVEADFIGHIRSFKNKGFQAYGIRGAYGVSKNIEVGANILVTRSIAGTPVEIQPNIKWKAYQNEDHNIAVSGGAIFFVPLNKKAGTKTHGMFYTNASKGIRKIRNMRVTAGAYTVVTSDEQFGSKNGAILGIEQPIHKRVNLIADWYSGKNRLGYSTAGLSVTVSKTQTLFAGYNFGNSGRGNNSLSVYYGIKF